jgi:hypothetical protein
MLILFAEKFSKTPVSIDKKSAWNPKNRRYLLTIFEFLLCLTAFSGTKKNNY